MQQITASIFELASCQATVFTPAGDLSVTKVMKELYPSVAELFDGAPTILPPLPEGAPLELPRIVLESRSQEWRCEFSPHRTNVTWRRLKTTSTQIELAEFFRKAQEVLVRHTAGQCARIGRIAGLATRFFRHEDPGLFLARHFCKERWDSAPLNRPENFELHAHKKFPMSGHFEVNSWARNKTGALKGEPPTERIVLFEQDINTLAEEASHRAFTNAEIEQFFEAIVREFDIILRLYYPNER